MNRRAFLRRAAALSVVGAGSGLAMNLAAAGEAAALTASDYKAVVCIFLYGGNDYANTVVPYDATNYDLYSAIRGGGSGRTRGGIAFGRDELAATALTPVIGQTLTDNMQYALAPELTNLAGLFNTGKAAIQLNIGTLVQPLTYAQYHAGTGIPRKLFSHNDQQSTWQTMAVEGATSGWGGRMGDLALSSNGQSLLTCISATGNTVFLSGAHTLQYEISTAGAVPIAAAGNAAYGSSAVASTLRSLITQQRSHILENEFSRVTSRSVSLEGVVTSALSPVSLATSFNPDGKANDLADQLQIVARLIAARNTLAQKRQVFFVSMGGFDNHDDLMDSHSALMTKLDEAVGAFYAATVEMGIADQVTTFTASDFGRTLASNGDGSDHGWGSHHFVVGGAVKGGRYFGTAPHVSLSTEDQVGQGRLLPTAAVDQLAGTLSRWFGVADSDLSTIAPNIGKFSSTDLGYFS